MARAGAARPVRRIGFLSTWGRRLEWTRFPLRAGALFLQHNAPGMAATVAFFGVLSLVPLVLLLLAFLGGVFGGIISTHDARQLFESVVPGLSQTQFQHAYWDPIRHSKVATTALGAASLLIGCLGLHDSVDWAVNRLWESTCKRSFWMMKLRGLAVILWVIAFALFSMWLTWLLAGVSGMLHHNSLAEIGWFALLPSVVVDTAVFTALYRLTPTVVVRMRPALVSGVAATLLWEISKVAFAYWVIEVGTYNRVYGPLAASVIVMLWVWISSMIFLYGASLSVVIQRAPRPAAERAAPPPEV